MIPLELQGVGLWGSVSTTVILNPINAEAFFLIPQFFKILTYLDLWPSTPPPPSFSYRYTPRIPDPLQTYIYTMKSPVCFGIRIQRSRRGVRGSGRGKGREPYSTLHPSFFLLPYSLHIYSYTYTVYYYIIPIYTHRYYRSAWQKLRINIPWWFRTLSFLPWIAWTETINEYSNSTRVHKSSASTLTYPKV